MVLFSYAFPHLISFNDNTLCGSYNFTPKQHIGDYFSNTSVVKLNFLNCYKYKFINQN